MDDSRVPNLELNTVQYNTTLQGITTIALNRPHRRNAVNGPITGTKLRDAFIRFEEDGSQKVCVFTGTGGTFCSGADLHDVGNQQHHDNQASNEGIVFGIDRVKGRNLATMGPSRMTISKPVIAAVAGYAVAGGLELSLLADIRVVEEGAIFGVFCRRWGIPLIDGGTVRLQAIIGLGRAMDMILTGKPVGAQEALSIGLASRVVPKGKALEEAYKIAEGLVEFPQRCMNADRSSCYYSAYNATSFEDALSHEYDEGVKVIASESIAGAARFSGGEGRHGEYKQPKSKL